MATCNYLKNRALTAIGSSLEWFDFSLYGFFAPIFSQIFFPDSQNHWVSLLTAYGVFAVGFVARPIGAILFGYIGDKYGRAIALKITPLGITFFTSIIAFFPNYDTAGSLSIVLLVIARIIQGVLLGGEYAGNIVYLYESSPFQKYLWGSFASCTGSLGIIFASGISALSYSVFSTAFLHNYGWRIAFLLSLPIGISIFLMRRKISESPEFITNQNINPLSIVFKAYKKNVLIGLGIILLHATSFYFVFMFLPVFLTQIRHLPESAALINNTWFLILHLVLIPVFGLAANYIGGYKSCKIISSLFVFLTLPIYYFLNNANNDIVVFCLGLLSVLTAVNAAIIPGLIAEITPNYVRYTVLALVFNIGFGIFGGLTPSIALLLTNKSHAILLPGYYLTFVALVTLISASLASKAYKAGKSNEIRKIYIA